jgi:hypothetical protein
MLSWALEQAVGVRRRGNNHRLKGASAPSPTTDSD